MDAVRMAFGSGRKQLPDRGEVFVFFFIFICF